MTTSGHFAVTHGLTGYEPKLTNSRKMVAWAESQNPHGAQAACGPISSVPPWRNFTEEANGHKYLNILAEQHIYWREQGRNVLNFQQAASKEQLKSMSRPTRDEVHVAVERATDMLRAEMQARMGALKNQAEQIWSSHQVFSLSEMNRVGGDALENQRRSLLNKATAERQRHQRQNTEYLPEYQQGVRRHLCEVQQEVQVQQVASREDMDNVRHDFSQSLAEGSHLSESVHDWQIWCVPKIHQTFSNCDTSVNM